MEVLPKPNLAGELQITLEAYKATLTAIVTQTESPFIRRAAKQYLEDYKKLKDLIGAYKNQARELGQVASTLEGWQTHIQKWQGAMLPVETRRQQLKGTLHVITRT